MSNPIDTPAAWLTINSIRVLAMDAVEAAQSGHPGTPMALAPAGYVLWRRYLKHAPHHPDWPDRDRFVMSCGHASLLQYSLLHLSGYDLSLDDIKQFRQWGSKTPGHPERGHTVGIEVTTGPLGQGMGNAVGMAIAERILARQYNHPGAEIVNHRTWAFASDGDMMEGVASEAASLAGHLRLGKLTVIYDDNHITIDGGTELSFSDDVEMRFTAYGWRVLHVNDGNDLAAIDTALADAAAHSERPTLIRLRTVIGNPAPTKEGTAEAHGAPLGKEEVAKTKEIMHWPQDPFHVAPEAYTEMAPIAPAGDALVKAWEARFAAHPDAAAFTAQLAGELPAGWDSGLPDLSRDALATRQASFKALDALARSIPFLAGGSADLGGSNGTNIKVGEVFEGDTTGTRFHWGVREHGMAAALNGMAAHGGVRPYGATFLAFLDYCKPSVRLAALMHLPSILLFSHDSIGLGEDGPTHQPVEHLSMMRAIPNMLMLRPADAAETVESWRVAIQHTTGPTALVLTRQKLPALTRNADPVSDVARGAYILHEPATAPRAIVIATGSEVQLAVKGAETLEGQGIPTRVVSMPSWELFAAQDAAWRERVLPAAITARVGVEAASSFGWSRWLGDKGVMIGLDHFGASAPAEVLFREYGFTAQHIVDVVRSLV
ncbi:MAG TPA: transketolase [Gemmatimonadales bacterium]|nr:transketolase [Gemmatimonadales bacterium]